MIINRPSLSKALIQAELNKFYRKPVARTSFGLILTIITVGFFALVAIKPTLETMADLIKQIEEKKTEDQKLSLKITTLATAQAELATKAQSSTILDSAVPATPLFSRLLKMIEKLAVERSVTYVSFLSPGSPTERDPNHTGTNLESIPFSITFSGTYQNISALLADLEQFQRILVIDRIDMTTNTEDPSLVNIALSARAFAFTPLSVSTKN